MNKQNKPDNAHFRQPSSRDGITKALKSGIPGLDRLLNRGLMPGSIIVVAGTVSSGKTTFALQMFCHLVSTSPSRGMVFSFEETEEQLKQIARKYGFGLSNKVSVENITRVAADRGNLIREVSKAGQKGNLKYLLINSFEHNEEYFEKLLPITKKYGITLICCCPAPRGYCKPGEPPPPDALMKYSDIVLFLDYYDTGTGRNHTIFLAKSRNAVFYSGTRGAKLGGRGFEISQIEDLDFTAERITDMNASVSTNDIEIDKFIIAEFKKIEPNVNLKLFENGDTWIAPNNAVESIKEKIRTGIFKEDVSRCNINHVLSFANAEIILPLDPYMYESNLGFFDKGLVDSLTFGNKIYAMPGLVQPNCLVYRKDLYRKYGLKEPSTWPQIIDNSVFLMKKNSKITAGLLYPNMGSGFASVFVNMIINNLDNGVTAREAVFDFKSKNYETTLGFFYDCMNKYRITPKDKKYFSGDEALEDYLKFGAHVFVLGYGKISGWMKKDEKTRASIGLCLFPAASSEKKRYAILNGSVFVIPVTAANPTYSAELINMLTTNKILKKIIGTGNTPVLSGRRDVNAELERETKYMPGAGRILENAVIIREVFTDDKFIRLVNNMFNDVVINKRNISHAIDETSEKMRKWSKDNYYDKIIDDVKLYIDKKINEKITIESIAAAFSYSKDYLNRFFKQRTGMNIYHYIIQVRIEIAKQLLKDHYNMNISQIADKAGFLSTNHFCTIFKKKTGKTPLDYRIDNAVIRQ